MTSYMIAISLIVSAVIHFCGVELLRVHRLVILILFSFCSFLYILSLICASLACIFWCISTYGLLQFYLFLVWDFLTFCTFCDPYTCIYELFYCFWCYIYVPGYFLCKYLFFAQLSAINSFSSLLFICFLPALVSASFRFTFFFAKLDIPFFI